jgi:CDP-diacylglycerol--glycerol-3-phosphate 3-phosphatidyltransferase
MLSHLSALARAIPVSARDVQVLRSPAEFYDTMHALTRDTRARLLWSSLYVGTGEKETKLVDAAAAMLAQRPSVRATFVMDGARCSRALGADSTCAQLARLQDASPRNSRVWLFESPRLRGGLLDWRARVSAAAVRSGRPAVARWREATGVWHMKLYIFDDTLVISGANLSDTYFTTRQDRYVVFRNAPALCDFYARFLDATTRSPSGLWLPPAAEGRHLDASRWQTAVSAPDEMARMQQAMREFIPDQGAAATAASASPISYDQHDSWVFPTFQMAPFHIFQDENVTAAVLGERAIGGGVDFPRGQLWLASGYLNLPDRFERALLRAAASATERGGSARNGATHLLSAAPQANGWYGASGIGGKVPALYAAAEYEMLRRLQREPERVRENVGIFEYNRPGWSYHAKGMWMEPATSGAADGSADGKAASEFMTAVGSPNYSSRSLEGDIETQLFLCTRDETLKTQFREVCTVYIVSHPRPSPHYATLCPAPFFSLPATTGARCDSGAQRARDARHV